MEKPAGAPRTRTAGDLIVVAALAAFIAFYLVDAIRASTDILNLILVLPLAVVALALCLAQFLISVRDARGRGPAAGLRAAQAADVAEAAEAGAPDRAGTAQLADVLRVVGLFAVYVLTLPWLGFDAGTCLFLVAFLRLHGERRWPRLLGYSIGFGLLTALFFSRMLPYPMPLLLLGAA